MPMCKELIGVDCMYTVVVENLELDLTFLKRIHSRFMVEDVTAQNPD